MACNCIFKITQKDDELVGRQLFEAYTSKYGVAVERIDAKQTVFCFGTPTVPVKLDLEVFLSNGKKKKETLIATYCPLCGLDANDKPSEVPTAA